MFAVQQSKHMETDNGSEEPLTTSEPRNESRWDHWMEGWHGVALLGFMVAPVYLIALIQLVPTVVAVSLLGATTIALVCQALKTRGTLKLVLWPTAILLFLGIVIWIAHLSSTEAVLSGWIQGVLTFGGVVIGLRASRVVEADRRDYDVKRENYLGVLRAAAQYTRMIREAGWKEHESMAPPKKAEETFDVALAVSSERITILVGRFKKAYWDAIDGLNTERIKFIQALFTYEQYGEEISRRQDYARECLANNLNDPEAKKIVRIVMAEVAAMQKDARELEAKLPNLQKSLSETQKSALNKIAPIGVALQNEIREELRLPPIDERVFTREFFAQNLKVDEFKDPSANAKSVERENL